MTSRTIGVDLVTESTSDFFIFAIMVKMEFAAGDITLHNGLGDVTHDGDTYKGVGDFGAISPIKETGDFSDESVTLQLSGLDTDMRDNALTANYYMRPITVFIVPFSKTTGAVLGTPKEIDAGKISSMGVLLGENDVIELIYESESARFKKANGRLNSNVDQQDEHSGDKFFEFVEQVFTQRLMWGSRPIQGSSGGMRTLDKTRIK